MKKKTKEAIINGIQFFLMIYTMTAGFWFEYLWIWCKVGLPMEWWSLLLTMVLAIASVFGLCRWIRNS